MYDNGTVIGAKPCGHPKVVPDIPVSRMFTFLSKLTNVPEAWKSSLDQNALKNFFARFTLYTTSAEKGEMPRMDGVYEYGWTEVDNQLLIDPKKTLKIGPTMVYKCLGKPGKFYNEHVGRMGKQVMWSEQRGQEAWLEDGRERAVQYVEEIPKKTKSS